MNDRRSIRLKGYDYSQPGAYFVTLCVHRKQPLLGTIEAGRMQPNASGAIAVEGWKWLLEKFGGLDVDIFCVMPNHVHAILTINGRGGVTPPLPSQITSDADTYTPTLGQMIGFYKYQTTKEINRINQTIADKFWQRNYYERIIRNSQEYEAAWAYIEANPVNWGQDEYNT